MHNKLQELTNKIYNEGVEKGNKEAENIISNAQKEAEKIINDARSKADDIIKIAEKNAHELNENTRSELKLASKQMINTVKQNITSVINGRIVSNPVKDVVSDKNFIKKIIETILTKWDKNDAESVDLDIILPADKINELNDFLKKELTGILNKSISLKYDNNLNSGFQIGPADGSYKLSFSEEEFENYFKEFLRPKLIELLFAE